MASIMLASFREACERPGLSLLEVVNCGHPPPLRRAAAGRVPSLSPQRYATPFGRSPELHSDTFTLTPQDRVVLYTDGLLESHLGGGPLLPLDRQVSDLAEADPAVAAGQRLDVALRHRRSSHDDAAVLVVDFV